MYKNINIGSLSDIEKKALYKRLKRRKPRPSQTQEISPTVAPPNSVNNDEPTEQHIPTDNELLQMYIDMLQAEYHENIKKINADTSDDADYIKLALTEADQIWLNVQLLIKSPKYAEMSDDDKIKLVQKDYKEFYKNFPIVARYMICMGQYKMDAFRKMLVKCKTTNTTIASRKNNNEKLWIERQADYIRFLWEAYQVNSEGEPVAFSQQDSDEIWQNTVDTLTKEFQDFRDMHEKTEALIKKEAVKHKTELIYEMSNRIITGKQNLQNGATEKLIRDLKDKLYIQRSKKLIKEIGEAVKVIPETTDSYGTNEYERQQYDEELKNSTYKKTYTKMDFSKLLK
jgi:hypothetical protein